MRGFAPAFVASAQSVWLRVLPGLWMQINHVDHVSQTSAPATSILSQKAVLTRHLESAPRLDFCRKRYFAK
jgi:hypothetical protein